MAGQRQPTDLVVMKGKKHLTKAEIEARKNAEVVAPNDKVKPPAYLTPEQKKKFRKLSKELLEIKLIANVDCDALARLLIAQDQYIEITDKIRETPLMVDVPVYEMQENPDTGEKERVQVGTREVAKVITFDMFSMMVDEALEQMRTMLDSNEAVQKLIANEAGEGSE